MKGPTGRQLQILAWCALQVDTRGVFPTHLEICARFGFRSSHAAHDTLRRIERHGLIARGDKFKARVTTITPLGRGFVGGSVSFVGTSAGPGPLSGFVDPASFRCPSCSRVFFGTSFRQHKECAPEDIAATLLGDWELPKKARAS